MRGAAGRPAPPCRRPSTQVGVLALAGDVAEHLRALELAGARPLAVRRPADLAGPLRQRVASGMPVFGSCAGMIMLASRLVDPASGQETVGAIDMTVRRNALSRQVDSFESDLIIAALDGGLYRGVFIRAPWAVQVGQDAETLAAEPRL